MEGNLNPSWSDRHNKLKEESKDDDKEHDLSYYLIETIELIGKPPQLKGLQETSSVDESVLCSEPTLTMLNTDLKSLLTIC